MNTLTNPPTMKWAAPFYLGSYSAIMGSPAIGADGTIYFVGADAYLVSSLVAVEPVAGTQEWTLLGAGCYGCSVAVGHDGNVYTSSDTDYNLYAVFPNGTVLEVLYVDGDEVHGEPLRRPRRHGVLRLRRRQRVRDVLQRDAAVEDAARWRRHR